MKTYNLELFGLFLTALKAVGITALGLARSANGHVLLTDQNSEGS